MKASRPRYLDGKLVKEIEFLEWQGGLVDLVRHSDDQLRLVHYPGDQHYCRIRESFVYGDNVLCPPSEDEITRHVRFAHAAEWEDSRDDRHPDYWPAHGRESSTELLEKLDRFIARCLDLDGQHRFLLACFVLSTWVVDRLPVAPYVALLGLPRSGKSTALKVLYLL